MSKPASPGSPASANPVDVSRYVADICGELAKMTKSAKLMMLTYLLAMVRQEAERAARDGALIEEGRRASSGP